MIECIPNQYHQRLCNNYLDTIVILSSLCVVVLGAVGISKLN